MLVDTYTSQSIQMELDIIDRSKENIKKILVQNGTQGKDPFIPNSEFKKAVGIGRFLFERLYRENKLRTTKRGRSIWVHRGDINRYKNGEIE